VTPDHAYAFVAHSIAAGRLAQAYVVAAPPRGAGEVFVKRVMSRLLCREDQPPCGHCTRCTTVAKGTHPDVHWIEPQKKSRVIGIDAMRDEFMPEIQRTSFEGGWKAGVIVGADCLNNAAANAFLKTLEEPPENAVIFLLATGTEGMLPTILSRCQELRVNPWPEDELAALLCELHGVEAAESVAAATVAAGNARRAAALLQDIAPVVRRVAIAWLEWITTRRRGFAAILADEMHRGVPPHVLNENQASVWKGYGKKGATDRRSGGGKAADGVAPGAAGLRRDLAIQLCEWLVLLYSEIMKCRELQDTWRPRVPEAREVILQAAASRSTDSVLGDMARIDACCAAIDRNLNIGLLLAVLSEELIDHAEEDRTALQGS